MNVNTLLRFAALVIALAALVKLSIIIERANAQSVGDVGHVGTLMGPDDGTPILPPISHDAITTEAGQAITTEAGAQLIVD